MAVYTTENTLKIGKPCRVFDATGNEIRKCTFCDTETGSIERFAEDENGRCVMNETRDDVIRVRETRPLPLHVEFI